VEGNRVLTAGTWKVWAGVDNQANAVEVTLA
jgi:hypothetical protein